MATRTVRLDDEAETALAEIRQRTGLSVSAALKRGLALVRDTLREDVGARPFDVYARLDLGPGGAAKGSAADAKAAVRRLVRRKHRR